MKTENKAHYFENELKFLKFVQNFNVNVKWINIFCLHKHKQDTLYKLNINEFVLLSK